MFAQLNKDTIMMVALIAVIIGCLYLYRELKKTKQNLASARPVAAPAPAALAQRRAVQAQTQVQVPAPAPAQAAESDSDEIKPANTSADEQ